MEWKNKKGIIAKEMNELGLKEMISTTAMLAN